MELLLFTEIKRETVIAIAFSHMGAVGKELSIKVSSFPGCQELGYFLRNFCKTYRFKEKGKGEEESCTYIYFLHTLCSVGPIHPQTGKKYVFT